jgi:hypothetical protein
MVETYLCTTTCQHNGRIFKAHERYPAGDVGPKPCEYLVPIVPAPPQDDKRVQRVIAELEVEIADLEKPSIMNGKKIPPHPATLKQRDRLVAAVTALKGGPATVAPATKKAKDGHE